ncbi:hypothetical protein BE17_15445, partial [Sorangium cellulosum]
PAAPHSTGAPYGEQPAAGWAPRRAQPKQPPKLVIGLAIGSVVLVIASAVAVWLALRGEPQQDDPLRRDLLPAQSASARPTQLSPSDNAEQPPRDEDETMRMDEPSQPASPPPASTFIIDLTEKKPRTRKPRHD